MTLAEQTAALLAEFHAKSSCSARLTYSAGGNRPRFCGKPGKYRLSDGTYRCAKHAKGRGVEVKP